MTNVYEMVFHSTYNLVHIQFEGCNFRCLGCIRKLTRHDYHLKREDLNKLESLRRLPFLRREELIRLVGISGARRAVLGGGEPTLDPELADTIKGLNYLNVETVLFTNGFLLNEELVARLEGSGLREVCVSVKAYDGDLHKFYTGKPNEPVLDAIKIIDRSKIKLRVESVLVPGLIDRYEIEKISQFIASIDADIPYRIDAFITVPGVDWKRPTQCQIDEAVNVAKIYLKNVSCFHAGLRGEGKVVILYPKHGIIKPPF